MLPGGPGYRDAQIGLVLREIQPFGAVDEHRRSFARVQSSVIHFTFTDLTSRLS